MEFCENILHVLVEWGIIMFETAGVLILLLGLVRGILQCIKSDPLTRLNLSKSMSMALSFKLGGEILRTVLIREFEECLFVGVIIILRAAMALLIHWEIKNEKDEHREMGLLESIENNSDHTA